MKLKVDSKVCHDEAVVYTDIDDKIMMMNVDTGEYYDFDDIASFIWRHINKPVSVEALCDKINDEFEVEQDQCRADTEEFLDDLATRSLIRIC